MPKKKGKNLTPEKLKQTNKDVDGLMRGWFKRDWGHTLQTDKNGHLVVDLDNPKEVRLVSDAYIPPKQTSHKEE